ncbi:MAG: YjjI family glycine radical enzyme [Caloramator sp.]|nr:YjjI family glycine radical enzyme [Caloramator sp.]
MNGIIEILSDTKLDYKQKRAALSSFAENSLPYVDISDKARKYMEDGIICNLNEGNAPYRPRYVLPDYKKYFENGSKYLNIKKPSDMYEAVNALLIIYNYVPSITGYPVYLGNIDELLEPYCDSVSERELENLLKMFLINIDRNLPDAFVHANIGPKDTKVGRIILNLEETLKDAVPNLSLKCSKDTPDDFIKLAIKTSLEIGKAYFINHDELVKVLGENYGIASCYNALKIGGGSFTLVRVNLKEVAKISKDYNDFIERVLPDVINCQCEIINERARFIVEKAKFFESSFLAREELININNFTSMAGIFGLYECVEILSGMKMGFDNIAYEMAENIIKRAYELVKEKEGLYCNGYSGKIGFHAQSGIDSDIDVSAGVRIKTGCEPEIFEQIKLEGKLQKYFDTGVSDIYIFDKTAKNNLEGVLTIIKGAFKNGIREMTINTSDSELIRITGYLVKRSDIEKYEKGEPLREGTVALGADSIKNCGILDRKVRGI